MRTVIGLFQDRNEARRTIADLTQIGVRESDVSTLSSDGSNGPITAYLDPAGGTREPDAIANALVRMGLSDDEARRYVTGVQHGYTLETVSIDDAHANEALEIMRRHALGGLGTEQDGAGRDATEQVLPVIAEELQVGKREVNAGGVHVSSHIESTPVAQDVSLRAETVDVQRRKVDRPVDASDMAALRNQDIEVLAVAEEPVVEKTARIVEEVVVTKDVDTRTERINDTVRRTNVDVQRLPYEAAKYQRHHESNYAASGGKFEDYEPAYRYGHEMRANQDQDIEKSDTADWSATERSARAGWEQRSPGTWDRFKGAIRHAWEGAKGSR